MKSGISYFDGTVVRKNITRFAPAWGLYSLGLLMFMVLLSGMDMGVRYAASVADTIGAMGVVNCIYALVCAQLLFGDLYSSRMCNALHAMPLRRETWFGSHVLSGLLFSLVPNLAITLVNLALSGPLWQVPLLWLGAATMQYLFFFGVAVLCVHCVGSRFAMAVFYVILNGFALIAMWLVQLIFAPLLYGVVLQAEYFMIFAPVVQMAGLSYLDVDYYNYELHGLPVVWEITEGWGYLAICAVVGLGLGALGLRLYRRRNLECAGDFLSVRGLGPVFLALYTLCAGACCHGFFDLVMGEDANIFLLLGFAIGFFTGSMLLERSIRVFRKKQLLGFGTFLLAFGALFLLVKLDPVGVTRWVPRADQVRAVYATTGGSYYYEKAGGWEEDAQIRDLLEVHRYAVENRDQGHNNMADVRLFLTYELESGRKVEREYMMDIESPVGQVLKQYLSSPESVLGQVYTQQTPVVRVEFPDPETAVTDPAQIQSLLEAVVADCLAADLPQDWAYIESKENHFWFMLEFVEPDTGIRYYRDIRATADAENLMAWLREHGIQPEKWQ